MDFNKSYETVFILDPSLTAKNAEQIFEKTKDFITENNGSIIEAANIGSIKLAYPIAGKNFGNYFFIEFKLNPSDVKSLDIFFKRNEAIIRYIICKLGKNGVEYNEKRRERKGKIINNQKILNLI